MPARAVRRARRFHCGLDFSRMGFVSSPSYDTVSTPNYWMKFPVFPNWPHRVTSRGSSRRVKIAASRLLRAPFSFFFFSPRQWIIDNSPLPHASDWAKLAQKPEIAIAVPKRNDVCLCSVINFACGPLFAVCIHDGIDPREIVLLGARRASDENRLHVWKWIIPCT